LCHTLLSTGYTDPIEWIEWRWFWRLNGHILAYFKPLCDKLLVNIITTFGGGVRYSKPNRRLTAGKHSTILRTLDHLRLVDLGKETGTGTGLRNHQQYYLKQLVALRSPAYLHVSSGDACIFSITIERVWYYNFLKAQSLPGGLEMFGPGSAEAT